VLVILLALTGGIGSGKSTVSLLLAANGAVIVDADEVAKQLQAPGGAVLAAMVERWGSGILQPDGTLNRQAVADIVFNEADELRALNKMTHPAVRREMARQAREQADTGAVTIMDTPLLVETFDKQPPFSGIVVVDVPPEVAVERLMRYRGFSDVDAWARISQQADRQERLGIAGFVIDNSGPPEALDEQVGRMMAWARTLAHVDPPPAPRERVAGDQPSAN
jgi:dephospho-CoA kinase